MKFTDVPKNIPERKYIVYLSGERWGENIIGIHSIKVDGDIIISDGESTLETYIPLEILPLKDGELNKMDVNHILIVTKRNTPSISFRRYKESDQYKGWLRDNNIDEIVNHKVDDGPF